MMAGAITKFPPWDSLKGGDDGVDVFCDDGDGDGGYMILMAGATTMTRKKTLAVHLEIGNNIFSLLFNYENLNHVIFSFNFISFCQYLSISKAVYPS